MTGDDALADRRRQLREQLAAQRTVLAQRLAAADDAPGRYPRSMTMRWLIREPFLLATAVRWIAGPRVAAAVPAALAVGRLLGSVAAANAARPKQR